MCSLVCSLLNTTQKFQFPSNGKAYPKQALYCYVDGRQVSIPFKRESVSKAVRNLQSDGTTTFCFNSLQTGKRIQSLASALGNEENISCFNSLQTGKRIQRENCDDARSIDGVFQFPSNGKAYPKQERVGGAKKKGWSGFNSLQTGKRIQREEHRSHRSRYWSVGFQFPSNGKAYPKICRNMSSNPVEQFQFPSNGKAYPKSP